MSDKTEQLVRELAEKLGTTGEHLWGVLIQQAAINAVTSWLIVIVMGVFLAIAYQVVNKNTTKTENWTNEGAFLAWMVFYCYAGICLIPVCCAIDTTATALLNPEYWALKQILPQTN